MCNKDAPRLQGSKATVSVSVTALKKPARRSRTKTRKPKFLSLLRLDLSPDQSAGGMTETSSQLDLFPLHPENMVEDKDENVAYFFDSADGGVTTLTTLLGARSSSSEEDEDALSPSSLTYAYGGQDSEEGDHNDLLRTALRNKERDPSEEKWVSYSEVVEERKDEEVTSCAAAANLGRCKIRTEQEQRRLSLKLDYQEIMNAWSDKGPLYIQLESESPQTVPDLEDDFWAAHDSSNNWGMKDGWGSSGGLWRVPENSSSEKGKVKVKAEEVILQELGGESDPCCWKLGRQREASVLRYKEKRQNRLFSKRIRYEVRKINAEKRPRMKGRFVKRS